VHYLDSKVFDIIVARCNNEVYRAYFKPLANYTIQITGTFHTHVKKTRYVHSDKYDGEKLEISKSLLSLCPVIVHRNILKASGHAINLLGGKQAMKEESRKVIH
jgi:hypothetical protein